MEVPLEQKMNMLWSFVKSHLNNKCIVFLSSCKQVKFVYEAFCRLRPGIPLQCLHGKIKQAKRVHIFQDFTQSTKAVLFATDIAARGLDFPAVDWVLQVDAPDDAATYVHRVGRTARYTAKGRALMLLAPSEKEGCVSKLEAAGVPLHEVKVNPAKGAPVTPALAALLSKSPDLKQAAQRAVQSYAR